jgi:hypothetical protein
VEIRIGSDVDAALEQRRTVFAGVTVQASSVFSRWMNALATSGSACKTTTVGGQLGG